MHLEILRKKKYLIHCTLHSHEMFIQSIERMVFETATAEINIRKLVKWTSFGLFGWQLHVLTNVKGNHLVCMCKVSVTGRMLGVTDTEYLHKNIRVRYRAKRVAIQSRFSSSQCHWTVKILIIRSKYIYIAIRIHRCSIMIVMCDKFHSHTKTKWKQKTRRDHSTAKLSHVFRARQDGKKQNIKYETEMLAHLVFFHWMSCRIFA